MFDVETTKILLVIAFVVAALVFVFNFLAMTIPFNKTGSDKYNFLRYFPFELNRFKRYQKSSYVFAILQFFASAVLITGAILFICVHHETAVFYVLISSLIISIISFNCLTYIKLSNFKIHLVFASICSFSTVLTLVLEFLTLTSDRGGIIISNPILNIIVIVLTLIFMMVLLANPSYKNWAKMVQVDAQTFNRPRFCYLAMLEWGTFLSILLSFLPLIIASF